jgi:hypothetical protein
MAVVMSVHLCGVVGYLDLVMKSKRPLGVIVRDRDLDWDLTPLYLNP